MNIFQSYKFRTISVVAIFMLTISFFLSFISVRQISEVSLNVFNAQGKVVMEKASGIIDAEKFAKLASSLDEKDPYYDELYNQLYELKQFYACRFLYTMAPVSGSVFTYVVDGSALRTDKDNFSAIGVKEDITSYGRAPFECIEKKIVTHGALEEQEGWGTTVSIYAPIVNKGKVVGFLACDFDGNELKSAITSSARRMITFAGIGLVISLIFVWLYIRRFFRKVDNVGDAMDVISSGAKDLTARIDFKGNNELTHLADSCNKVIAGLQEMILSEKESVEGLAKNSRDLMNQNERNCEIIGNADKSVQEIYAKASNQTELTERATAVIEDYVCSVIELDDKTKAQKNAIENSSTSIKHIMENINDFNDTLEDISREYGKIVEETTDGKNKQKVVAEKIEQIENLAVNLNSANAVISKISSQTNLLAMNAAIEAAHAGEAGKGFSVVADEIRKLSETSAVQTKSVSELLSSIQESIKGIGEASDTSSMSFNILGERIQALDKAIADIKQKITMQNEEGRKIENMMKIILDASSTISSSSGLMKEKNTILESHIADINASARQILESSETSRKNLQEMQVFANETNQESQKNLALCEKVQGLVTSYKTE